MISELTLPELATSDRHSLKRGPFGGALKKEIFVEEGYVVYEQQHAIYKNFSKARYYIDDEKYNDLIAFKVESGDLIISCSGTIGKIAEVPIDFKPGIINQALLKLSLNQDIVLNKFFIYLFESETIQDKLINLSHGTGLKNFPPMSVIKSIKFPIPPLNQQKKIAAILDAADTYRQKTKALIAKYDELTQSLFLDMFGDPVTNPKEWDKKPMGELMTIVRGGSPRPIDKFLGGTYPWIKIGDATKGDDIYLNSTKQCIIEEGLSKTRLLPKGSLIFANCGVSLGFARIINIEGCIHDGWLAFSNLNSSISKMFLLKALNNITRYFRETAPDGTQPNLNSGIMKAFKIILPPIELQNKFELSLVELTKQKAQAQNSLKQADNLFNSLLQKAFKGELING